MANDDIRFDWSPDGASAVAVEWIIPEAGRFGRDRHVSRADASHAKITETGGAASGSRVVTRGEADAYVAELTRAAAEHGAKLEADAAERQRWRDGLSSRCPHCGDEPRYYDGRQRLQSGGAGAEMVFGALSVSNVDVHVYICGYCGSIELFQDRQLPHPLPGNSSA
ncbi:MAG: hypothetical protein QOG33_1778 [Gaiellales bacterium]|jgi:hypothetical protein|nr:hypothetical protein [Gaiellales bacterium]